MIKANELRIGNLLLKNNDVCQVSTIHSDSTIRIFSEDKTQTFGCFALRIFNPIPLTEEWLIKLGFEKFIGWDDMEYWRLKEDEKNFERFEIMPTLKGYELPSGKICEYLHQLQNCYFFHELTGKELTYVL